MINYNEMEKVINNLNTYVENLQKINDTQQKLDEYIIKFEEIKTAIKNIEDTTNEYTKTIKSIEDDHSALNSQVEVILQDYKKLHSSFELIELEFKKIHYSNENISNAILTSKQELENLLSETKTLITNNQKQMLKTAKDMKKNNNIWFGVLTALASAILIAIIVV